jgi:alkylation response protein AidB-like acyl-CoA dehydrogenase
VGQNVGDATASLMKISWSETAQEIDELMIEALGAYAVADQHGALESGSNSAPIGPDYALTPMSRYLNDWVLTIAGGSSEVQRNILARNALHLDP